MLSRLREGFGGLCSTPSKEFWAETWQKASQAPRLAVTEAGEAGEVEAAGGAEHRLVRDVL